MTRKRRAFGAKSMRDAQKTGAKRARARPARLARVLAASKRCARAFGACFVRFRRRRRGFGRGNDAQTTRIRRKINVRRAENRRKARTRSAGVFCASFCSIKTLCGRVRCVFCAFAAPTAAFWTPKMTRKRCAFGAKSMRDAQKTGAKRARARPARFARVFAASRRFARAFGACFARFRRPRK